MTVTDYTVDAKDRLWELLSGKALDHRDRLRRSVDAAGAQMEWCKPAAIGPGKDAWLYAGPVVTVEPGTVLVVLAHHEKVFPIWMRPAAGTLGAAIEGAAEFVKSKLGPGLGIASVIEGVVDDFGRPPSLDGVELPDHQHANILGLLFAATPAEMRARMVTLLEMIVTNGVCPAMVGLLGDGSETGLSGAWPLILPLAPYANAVLCDMNGGQD